MNDVDDDYRWVEEIPLAGFSNKALVVVQSFSRVLRQVSGKVLTLQDPMLGRLIVNERDSNDDAKLHLLFDSLLEELSKLPENQAIWARFSSVGLDGDDSGMDKPVMYRGVAVGEPLSAGSKMAKDTSDKPKTKSSKKKMYRGVEI